MYITSDVSDPIRASAPLVLIDAQALVDGYGCAAFWQARARQARRGDTLGRNRDHWRHVAEVLRGSDVFHGNHAGNRA